MKNNTSLFSQDNLIREGQILLLSLSIFTRIPVSASVPYSEERKNESYKYCGLVGVLVGCLTALVYLTSSALFPTNVSVVLSMIFSVYITGAFHEDGFADTCDGFGGGFTAQRKLAIMKDSRVGAYALVGVILMLLLKYSVLTELGSIPLALIIAHTASRTVAVSYIYTHGYVREAQESKLNIVPPSNQRAHYTTSLIICALVLITLLPIKQFILLVVVLTVVRWLLGRWMVSQVGGYTGDALGAAQQITEVACYLMILSI